MKQLKQKKLNHHVKEVTTPTLTPPIYIIIRVFVPKCVQAKNIFSVLSWAKKQEIKNQLEENEIQTVQFRRKKIK